MTADNYNPSTSLTAYYPTRPERAQGRHWATEKLIHDMSAVGGAGKGFLTFFEGPGPNPLALSGASTSKLWLDCDEGVTASSGILRRYSGSGSAADEANWVPLDTAGYLLHLGSLSPITTIENFATRTAAVAASIASGMTHLRTAGYAAVGDRGGCLYFKDVALRDGGFQSADGAYWTPVPEHDGYNVLAFGADPTGTNASHTAIINAIKKVVYDGGGKVKIPRGTYKVGATISAGEITCNIDVEFEPGAELVAATGLAVTVFQLRASETALTDYTCLIVNPKIDCSDGYTPSGGGGYCTALHTQYFRQAIIRNVDLYGGTVASNSNADSGITTVDNAYTLIDGGTITGFSDSGIYVNGGNDAGTADDGVTLIAQNLLITRCTNAGTAKRQINHVIWDNNWVAECVAGFGGFEVSASGSQPFVAPPRRMDVVNNRFIKVKANCWRFRGPTKGTAKGNRVIDWGYDPDGTGSAGANATAVRLDGASNIDMEGNTFELVDWAADDHRAVNIANLTTSDGTVYTGGGHHFHDNVYRGCVYGLVDTSGTTASSFIDEYFDGVTNYVGGTHNASSVLIFRDVASPRLFSRTNGITRPVDEPMYTRTADLTLTALESGGSYRNDAATSLVTYTLPDAAAGLEFEFIVTDVDGIRVQAATGDTIRTPTGISTSGGYTESTTLYSSVRLKAISASIWVGTSETGTWTVA